MILNGKVGGDEEMARTCWFERQWCYRLRD